MKYALYPGCSLESSSVAYEMSVREVAAVLGIDLVEIRHRLVTQPIPEEGP